MSQENLDAGRHLFKALEERDLAGVLDACDPDIVIREAASLLYGGVYHGVFVIGSEGENPATWPRARYQLWNL